MTGKTHLSGGLAVAAIVSMAKQLPLEQGMVCIVGCAIGSLIPDIDHRGSTIGRRIKPISTVASAVAGHRSFFHWFLPYLLLTVGVHFWHPEFDLLAQSVLAGILSHLFLDALTPAGIPLVPKVKIHLMKIHTRSWGDRALGKTLSLTATICFIYWGLSMVRGY